jgi:hypothetical protein
VLLACLLCLLAFFLLPSCSTSLHCTPGFDKSYHALFLTARFNFHFALPALFSFSSSFLKTTLCAVSQWRCWLQLRLPYLLPCLRTSDSPLSSAGRASCSTTMDGSAAGPRATWPRGCHRAPLTVHALFVRMLLCSLLDSVRRPLRESAARFQRTCRSGSLRVPCAIL